MEILKCGDYKKNEEQWFDVIIRRIALHVEAKVLLNDT